MQNKALGQIESKLEQSIPQQLQQPYQQIVAAGMKVMFSPQSGPKIFAGAFDGDVSKRLALITASVISMLSAESKQTMPLDAAMPAAITLLLHALDMAQEAKKIQITPQVAQSAILTLQAILKQQLDVGSKKQQQAPQAPIPAQPQGVSPQPAGLISAPQGA